MTFSIPRSSARDTAQRPKRSERHQRVLDLLVAIPIYAMFGLFRLLPLDVASALGGWIARMLGPRTGASRGADANLRLALPELSAADRRRIVTAMWDNLGRIVAEFPHLAALRRREARAPDRIRVAGLEHLEAARAGGRPVVFAVAHFGNWEISPIAAANLGLSLTAFYRPLKNRLIDGRLRRIREALGTRLLEKRMEGNGAKQALSILREGGVLGMLVDQRYTGGLELPFFGRDALTSPAAVSLASMSAARSCRCGSSGGAARGSTWCSKRRCPWRAPGTAPPMSRRRPASSTSGSRPGSGPGPNNGCGFTSAGITRRHASRNTATCSVTGRRRRPIRPIEPVWKCAGESRLAVVSRTGAQRTFGSVSTGSAETAVRRPRQ
jgi:KDO2-lipid IV(A) lauroyltransferase